jgi:CheY-like chemotaxis protein
VAADAEAALRYLELVHVDLVITDWQMPGTDGIELLRLIRQQHPQTRRVLTTGARLAELPPLPTDVVEAVLQKPVERERLLSTVIRLCRGRRSDRRQHPRRSCALPVLLQRGGEPTFSGEVRDASAGGLFVHSSVLAPTGTALAVYLALADGARLLVMQGVVAWGAALTARGPGMGLRRAGRLAVVHAPR